MNWNGTPGTSMQLPGTSGRYTSTDPKLLHWTLADSKFAKVVDASGTETGAAVAGIGAPMFYPIPNPAEGGPDHILTSNEGEVWAVGKYDPQTETMTVQENQTAERPVFGLNYLVKIAMLSRLVCRPRLANPKASLLLAVHSDGPGEGREPAAERGLAVARQLGRLQPQWLRAGLLRHHGHRLLACARST